MTLIGEVVQQVIANGYLTVQIERQLRQLFATTCDLEDLDAFIKLQQATMAGHVRQESRELIR